MATVGKSLMVLSLADHTIDSNGMPLAYEPYVREMDLWCELFDTVTIYTNILPFEDATHKYAYFKHQNVCLINLYSYPINGSFKSKIIFTLLLPVVAIQLLCAIRKYEFVNIRNSALLSAILGSIVRVFNKPSITKWAGSYMPYDGEPLVAKIDRKVVDIYAKRHRVLVYDTVKKKHFVNFIPALMYDSEISNAEAMSIAKPSVVKQLEIVAIGRLQYTKNFELIPKALGLLKLQNPDFDWHFHLIGDGHLRQEIEESITKANIRENVTVYGAMPFTAAQHILAKSHVLIMPGVKEGWPKPVAEAWAHNVFPLAANRGNLPDIIDTVDKGILFEPTAEDLAAKIEASYIYLSDKKDLDLTRFARDMSLENFKRKLAIIIKELL